MADIKENVIEWVNGQDRITVSLHQGRYITRVKNLAKRFPDLVQITARNKDGSICAHLPLSALKLSIYANSKVTEEAEETEENTEE